MLVKSLSAIIAISGLQALEAAAQADGPPPCFTMERIDKKGDYYQTYEIKNRCGGSVTVHYVFQTKEFGTEERNLYVSQCQMEKLQGEKTWKYSNFTFSWTKGDEKKTCNGDK